MAGLPRGAVPTPLVATMAAKNGGSGSDKPFTYCPGGVDFSELKSPKMSRRIARNQEQGAAAANQRQVLGDIHRHPLLTEFGIHHGLESCCEQFFTHFCRVALLPSLLAIMAFTMITLIASSPLKFEGSPCPE